MVEDMIFHELDRQTVHRSTDGSDQLEDFSATELGFEAAFDGFQLAFESSDAGEKLGLILDCMNHSEGGVCKI